MRNIITKDSIVINITLINVNRAKYGPVFLDLSYLCKEPQKLDLKGGLTLSYPLHLLRNSKLCGKIKISQDDEI